VLIPVYGLPAYTVKDSSGFSLVEDAGMLARFRYAG